MKSELMVDPRRRGGGVELYDLEKNPGENRNLADDAQYKDFARRLQAELERWQRDKPAPIRIEGMAVPAHLFIEPKLRAQGALKSEDD